MGRAKGKKHQRHLQNHKGDLQDGWHTHVPTGQRALVRFQKKGPALVQFLDTISWVQRPADDFMRSDLYDELHPAAGADVHDADRADCDRNARTAGPPVVQRTKRAKTNRRKTPK